MGLDMSSVASMDAINSQMEDSTRYALGIFRVYNVRVVRISACELNNDDGLEDVRWRINLQTSKICLSKCSILLRVTPVASRNASSAAERQQKEWHTDSV
jgi:hypothetical protein